MPLLARTCLFEDDSSSTQNKSTILSNGTKLNCMRTDEHTLSTCSHFLSCPFFSLPHLYYLFSPSSSLKNAVRVAIGPIATPDFIVYCDLPKTRSGKIMRRILRKIASGEEDSIGDTSTLADPTVSKSGIHFIC